MDEDTSTPPADRRWCYYVDETMLTEGGYVPAVVYENESGYYPLSGDPEKFKAPWVWGHDIVVAMRVAAEANAELGLTPEDVQEIITSSMYPEEEIPNG